MPIWVAPYHQFFHTAGNRWKSFTPKADSVCHLWPAYHYHTTTTLTTNGQWDQSDISVSPDWIPALMGDTCPCLCPSLMIIPSNSLSPLLGRTHLLRNIACVWTICAHLVRHPTHPDPKEGSTYIFFWILYIIFCLYTPKYSKEREKITPTNVLFAFPPPPLILLSYNSNKDPGVQMFCRHLWYTASKKRSGNSNVFGSTLSEEDAWYPLFICKWRKVMK